MLISCTYSIVGLHILLLSHIAHSFVLLTANVEDVKKIARKFVSDSLAEKIADFIARATETIGQNTKNSEENESNAEAQERSQVSSENRMYSVEKYGSDSQAAEVKSKEEILLGKPTTKTFVEKKGHGFENPITTSSPKHRKKPMPIRERSRYIEQTEKRSLATEKALSNIREEENYNAMKQSIHLLQNNLLNQNKNIEYKPQSSFETVDNVATNDGIPDNKGIREDESFYNFRAVDSKKLLSLPTEEAATEIEQHIKNHPEKAVTDVAQHETKDDKNTEMVNLTEDGEFDHDENKMIQSTEKVVMIGSRPFVAKTGGKEEKWWEKELSAHNQEVQKKTWF